MLGHELLLFKTMNTLRAPAEADHRSDQVRRRRTVAETQTPAWTPRSVAPSDPLLGAICC